MLRAKHEILEIQSIITITSSKKNRLQFPNNIGKHLCKLNIEPVWNIQEQPFQPKLVMSIHVWLGSFLFFALDASPCASTIKPFFRNLPEYHHKNITFWKPFEVHSLETPQQNRCWFIFGTYLFCRNLSLLSFPVVSRYGEFSPTLSYTLSVDFYGFSCYVTSTVRPIGPYRLGFGFPFSASVDGAAGPVHVWTREKVDTHVFHGDRWKTLVHWTTLKFIESLRVLWLYVLFVYLLKHISYVYIYIYIHAWLILSLPNCTRLYNI